MRKNHSNTGRVLQYGVRYCALLQICPDYNEVLQGFIESVIRVLSLLPLFIRY